MEKFSAAYAINQIRLEEKQVSKHQSNYSDRTPITCYFITLYIEPMSYRQGTDKWSILLISKVQWHYAIGQSCRAATVYSKHDKKVKKGGNNAQRNNTLSETKGKALDTTCNCL